jgi:hypothetical protein
MVAALGLARAVPREAPAAVPFAGDPAAGAAPPR